MKPSSISVKGKEKLRAKFGAVLIDTYILYTLQAIRSVHPILSNQRNAFKTPHLLVKSLFSAGNEKRKPTFPGSIKVNV